MKKFRVILVVFFLITRFLVSAQLSGTYTIGINGNYTNFTSAVNALATYGISGPVVFNITPGTYYEQISIPQITGSSQTNTIIFQSLLQDSTSVIINYASSSWPNDYVVELNGADWLCFRKITMKSVSTGVYVGVFIMRNSANNNKIENCVLESPYVFNPSSSVVANIQSNNGLICSRNAIINNRIINGKSGISFYGADFLYSKFNQIINNQIVNSFQYGIVIHYQDSIHITNNTFEFFVGISGGFLSGNSLSNYTSISRNNFNSSSTAQSSSGIYINNSTGIMKILENQFSTTSLTDIYNIGSCIQFRDFKGKLEITNNKIYTYSNGSSPVYTLYLKNCSGSATEPILIANNMISNFAVSGTTAACISLQNDTNVLVYNNSTNLTMFGTPATNTYAFYQTGCSNLKIANNIFENHATGVAAYHATPSAVVHSDYNNYYSAGNNLAYWNGNKSSLSALRSANLMDSNSVSMAVNFVSNTDLHLTSADSGLVNKGLVLSEVTRDFDGHSRLFNCPDIGADEFQIPVDLQAIGIVCNPQGECYSNAETIKMRIRNNGNQTVHFANDTICLTATASGVNPVVFPVVCLTNDSLMAGDSVDVVLNSAYNMTLPGSYYFNAEINTRNDWDTTNNKVSTISVSNDLHNVFPFYENIDSLSITANPDFYSNNWKSTGCNGFQWQINTGSTPTLNTGPSGNHTVANPSGNYFYTEADSGSFGDTAVLFTTCFDISSLNAPQLVFWYHLYGSGTGSLKIDIYNGSSWITDIYSLSGQQQTGSFGEWKKAMVDLTSYAGTIKLRFRAIRGANQFGDMAIDDIAIGNKPSIGLPVNMGLCHGNQIQLNAGFTAGCSYLWQKQGSGNIIGNSNLLTVDTVGIYIITVTDTVLGFQNSDSVNVFFYQPTTVTFTGLPSVLCIDNQLISLSGTPSGGTFTGSGISGNLFNPASAGQGSHQIVYLSPPDTNGCYNSDTQTVIIHTLPVVDYSGLPVSCCVNSPSILLTGNPQGGTFYGTGIMGNLFNPSVAGAANHTITYSYTDSNSCSNSSIKTIYVNPLPFANAGLNQTMPCGGTGVMIGTGSTSGFTYHWSPTAGLSDSMISNPVATPSITTVYTLEVTNISSGCKNTDDIIVSVSGTPNITISNDTSFCKGGTATITANGGSTYQWNTGAVTQTINVTPTITSMYVVTVTQGICSTADTVIVTVYQPPLVNLGNDTILCTNQILILDAGSGNTAYNWSTGENTQNILVDSADGSGTYWVHIIDANTCENADTVNVTFISCIGIEEQTAEYPKITIFPNPNKGSFSLTIESPDVTGDLDVCLYDIYGKRIECRNIQKTANKTHQYFDFQGLAEGIYFMRISGEIKLEERIVVIKE